LRANAVILRKTGERIQACTLNVSGSGVLLEMVAHHELQLGEEVGCQIHLYEARPPQDWGVGRVVRIDNSLIAVEFTRLDWDS